MNHHPIELYRDHGVTPLDASPGAPLDTTMANPDTLTLVSRPSPFEMMPELRQVPAGSTVRELVAMVDPIAAKHNAAAVFLAGDVIAPEYWDRVRIRAGQVVSVVPVPQGGDSKDILRVVALIAVVIAAFYAPYLVPEFVAGMEIAGSSLTVAQALTAGTALLGTMAVNALFPPAVPQFSGGSDLDTSYAITGTRNAFNPNGAVPRILGTVRIFPPLAAKPYTEVQGDNQYFNLLVCEGQGPLKIGVWKIGDTPITEFSKYRLAHIHKGEGKRARFKGWDAIPTETGVGTLVTNAIGRVVRRSALNADRISLDLMFLKGLFKLTDEAKQKPTQVDFDVSISPAGLDQWETVGTLTVKKAKGPGFRISFEIPDLPSGQYDVGVTRTTADNDDNNRIQDEATWSVIRSFTDSSPITDWTLAYTALRIKATDQLNGGVDELNCIATSIVPDYSASAGAWITRASDNPASLFRTVLQDAQNPDPLSDDEIDLAALEAWHVICKTNSWRYGRVLAGRGSVWDRLLEICAVGRARPVNADGKWSVIVDVAQTVPVQLFNGRNSWGSKVKRLYHELPQVYFVDFQNEEQDYKPDEMVVYVDGYTSATVTQPPASIKFPGNQTPDQIWKAVQYLHAQAKLRPEVFEKTTKRDHLMCTQGSLVLVADDIVLWGLHSARIKAVAQSGADVTGLTLEAPVPFETGKSYSIRIRSVKGGLVDYAIDNPAAETATITFTTPIDTTTTASPLRGDLCTVGENGIETVPCLVKEIIPTGRDTARLELVEAAVGIHSADTGTIPNHDPKITAALSLVPPPTPVIDAIRSDESVLARDTDGSLIARIVADYSFDSGVQAALVEVEGQIRLASETSTVTEIGDTVIDNGLFAAPPLGDAKAILFDLPILTDTDDVDAPRVVGRTRPWPDKMNLWKSTDGGSTYAVATAMAGQGKIGTTKTVFASGVTSRWDESQTLDVYLEAGALSSSTDALVAAGANWAAIETSAGKFELIGFVNVTDLGGRTYRLSRLLRGLNGSDAEMVASLATGARFILLDETVRQPSFDGADVGVARDWKYGPASLAESDAFHATEVATFNGLGLRPYSPAHGALAASGNDRVIGWTRRDRTPGLSGADTWDGEIPQSESSELYDLEIINAGSPVRTLTDLALATYTYLEADQITDFGSVQSSLDVKIYHKSSTYTGGRGAALEATVSL